jgi:DNA-binding NarL/FixJ family response regulator
MSPKTIRVLIADDYALFRAGIRALIEKTSDIEVVAESVNGLDALNGIKTHQPDLVLLDMTLPGLTGLELEKVHREFPDVRMIIMTTHENPGNALGALRAGAHGYLPKKAAGEELVRAIRSVMMGTTYVSPEVSRQSLSNYRANVDDEGAMKELTPRQLDVLRMIAEGYSTKEIARELNISSKTVESHRASLMQRLDIHDVAGLVRYAIKTGLVKMAISLILLEAHWNEIVTACS